MVNFMPETKKKLELWLKQIPFSNGAKVVYRRGSFLCSFYPHFNISAIYAIYGSGGYSVRAKKIKHYPNISVIKQEMINWSSLQQENHSRKENIFLARQIYGFE